MFFCMFTKKFSAPGEAQHKVIISKRPKEYSAWRENDDEEWIFVKVSSGWEIEKELPATEEGLKLWESWSPEQQAIFSKSFEKPTDQKTETKRRMAK